MAVEVEDDATQATAVIGAGIVGVSVAHFLQRDGHRVVLIERGAPGAGTSYGNAGAVVTGSPVPLGTPRMLWRVPGMLLDPCGPLALRWRYLPRLAPWLFALIRASSPARVAAIARDRAALAAGAEQAWRTILRGSAVEGLLRPYPWLEVYDSDAGFAETAGERASMTDLGVPYEVLDADALRQLEPALARFFRHGFLQGGAFVANPGRTVEALATRFVAEGGRLLRAEVRDLEPLSPGWRIATDGAPLCAARIVVAAGAWSRRLARRLGLDVPLDTERGYHAMLTPVTPGLSHPTYWGERGFVLAPMEQGLRLTTGVEFAGLEAPPDFRRVRRMIPLAQRMLPGLEATPRSLWLGHRPSLPDSKPVIGRVPAQADAFLAFGHGHLGLTLGPVTGRIVADLVAGRDPGLDLAPFRADRNFAGRLDKG